MVDRDGAGAVEQLEQTAVAPAAADVEEQVVADRDAPGLLARMVVVAPEHVDAGGDVPDEVVRERDVLDHRPGRAAVLVAHGEENGESVLRVRPVVFEQVAVDEDAPRVLELEEVLDAPLGAFERGVVFLPAQRLRHVVLHDLDVGRHQIGNARIGAAEHHVLARGLEEVARDLERPGPFHPAIAWASTVRSLKSER